MPIDPWLERHLVCPRTRLPLRLRGDRLVSDANTEYPVVDGVPVLLLPDERQTIGIAEASLARARGERMDARAPQYYLESLGISEEEKTEIVRLAGLDDRGVDPVVSLLVGATNGIMYKDCIGKLQRYPIPQLRLEGRPGSTLLDIGCGWGRWTIAAAQQGYTAVGIDPSLGAVMAAIRAARQMGVPTRYVVAEGRFLPFRDDSFDAVFSYSVLQHLSPDDVRAVLREAARVLRPDGACLVQMPNRFGLRCLYHQARRRFREPSEFEVRYWRVHDLRHTFSEIVGPTVLSVDCFFGLGLQNSDADLMPAFRRALIRGSEVLRKLSTPLPVLIRFADSVYVHATKSRARREREQAAHGTGA